LPANARGNVASIKIDQPNLSLFGKQNQLTAATISPTTGLRCQSLERRSTLHLRLEFGLRIFRYFSIVPSSTLSRTNFGFLTGGRDSHSMRRDVFAVANNCPNTACCDPIAFRQHRFS
jgi:hypothetical protein